MRLVLTATTPLTSLPGRRNPAVVFPNGHRVAYVWGGENNNNSDIYIRRRERRIDVPADDECG